MAPSTPQPEAWLLIVASTAGTSSTVRVHAWRTLRSLGALYLHGAVALLPQRPHTAEAVERLLARLRDEGCDVWALSIVITDATSAAALVDRSRAERADEYAEVVVRAHQFLDEIDHERAKGRTTFTEVDESDADLARLRTWIKRIASRDYFEAPGRADADAAIEACAAALAAFESDAIDAEASER